MKRLGIGIIIGSIAILCLAAAYSFISNARTERAAYNHSLQVEAEAEEEAQRKEGEAKRKAAEMEAQFRETERQIEVDRIRHAQEAREAQEKTDEEYKRNSVGSQMRNLGIIPGK